MEKITLNICGRNYYLKANDSTDRITNLGKTLENMINEYKDVLVNKSEEEVLTLVALNILDDTDKVKTELDNEKKKLEKEVSDITDRMTEQEKQNIDKINASISSAESELSQIATIKDDENEKLRSKLLEYEIEFERLIQQREVEINKLKESFESAKVELENIATIKENDNAKLRNTLSSYETTFDLYVKSKEEELINLQKQLEEANIEIESLRQRLAAVTDDGQIKIC